MDRCRQSSRPRSSAWLQPGGLTLLIAVSVVASAASGLENARRVADTGVRLVHALVAAPAAMHTVEAVPTDRVPGWTHRPACMSGGQNAPVLGGTAPERAAHAGLLDLPPPTA